ncbi:hypothetical protein [Chryseobacterium sp. JK1]|uniref:hypothetical protein n=1 Tax=Chryseobacterium sp. JK1 TaxID=874294 RepID=UPI003D68EB87
MNRFAEATLDDQWIRVNEERTKNEDPFKCTIAHGYLLLVLIPYLWKQIAEVRNVKMKSIMGLRILNFVKLYL